MCLLQHADLYAYLDTISFPLPLLPAVWLKIGGGCGYALSGIMS